MVLAAREAEAALQKELMGGDSGATKDDDIQKDVLHTDSNKEENKESNKDYLGIGLTGFLCICNPDSENESCTEALSLLRYFGEFIYGWGDLEPRESFTSFDCDIEVNLVKEMQDMRSVAPSRNPRFSKLNTDADGVFFMKMRTCPYTHPWEITTTLFEEIANTRQKVTHNLHNLIPVEITCLAKTQEIANAVEKIVFPKFIGEEPTTYNILFWSHLNQELTKPHVVDCLEKVLKDKYPHCCSESVSPRLHIVIVVLKNICCITVLQHYVRYREYSLLDVAKHGPNLSVPVDRGVQDFTRDPEIMEDDDMEVVILDED